MPNSIANKCQSHARQMPNKCQTIYQTNAIQYTKQMPYKCQTNAKQMPDKCQTNAKQ